MVVQRPSGKAFLQLEITAGFKFMCSLIAAPREQQQRQQEPGQDPCIQRHLLNNTDPQSSPPPPPRDLLSGIVTLVTTITFPARWESGKDRQSLECWSEDWKTSNELFSVELFWIEVLAGFEKSSENIILLKKIDEIDNNETNFLWETSTDFVRGKLRTLIFQISCKWWNVRF